jgi:hypothetical protein
MLYDEYLFVLLADDEGTVNWLIVGFFYFTWWAHIYYKEYTYVEYIIIYVYLFPVYIGFRIKYLVLDFLVLLYNVFWLAPFYLNYWMMGNFNYDGMFVLIGFLGHCFEDFIIVPFLIYVNYFLDFYKKFRSEKVYRYFYNMICLIIINILLLKDFIPNYIKIIKFIFVCLKWIILNVYLIVKALFIINFNIQRLYIKNLVPLQIQTNKFRLFNTLYLNYPMHLKLISNFIRKIVFSSIYGVGVVLISAIYCFIILVLLALVYDLLLLLLIFIINFVDKVFLINIVNHVQKYISIKNLISYKLYYESEFKWYCFGFFIIALIHYHILVMVGVWYF